MHAVFISGDIDIDDVTFFNHGGIRNAVADDFIQRNAAALGKSPVPQGRWVRAVVTHILVRHAVDLIRRHARLYGLAGFLQRVGRDLAGLPHLLNHFGGLHKRLADGLLYLVFPHIFRALDIFWHRPDGGWFTWLQFSTSTHNCPW